MPPFPTTQTPERMKKVEPPNMVPMGESLGTLNRDLPSRSPQGSRKSKISHVACGDSGILK